MLDAIEIMNREQRPPVDNQTPDNLEGVLDAARPRLLHFARRYGISPDATEDVVQETLLEAWRHLNHLRDASRFDAWLSGICRNVCRRWIQSHSAVAMRQESLSSLSLEVYETEEEDIADPFVLDPIEELSRQDMEMLLDKALGYLSNSMRIALELCFFAEVPSREAAARLGISVNTLDVRLHRARRQLRQVLTGILRTEAEDFGLVLDQDTVKGWRETRIWCMFCGRHHLHGRFEMLPDGRVDLRMYCPGCKREWLKSGGMFELVGFKSFRPALNRVLQLGTNYWTSEKKRQQCLWCGKAIKVRLLGPGESLPWLSPWQGYRFVTECPSCGSGGSSYVGTSLWLHPLVQRFIEQHPRWMQEPEVLTEYAGQPAFRIHLTDIMSASRLTLLLSCETLQVLASFQE